MNIAYPTIKSVALCICIMGTILSGCKGNDTLDPMEYVGSDQLTRIVVSPNSPVLVTDGNSRLTLSVQGYYNYEGEEYEMPRDRLPLDEITITGSNGETFKAGDTFSTTKGGGSELTFTASLPSGLKSAPVSVLLETPETVSNIFDPITIPVIFSIYYTEAEEQGIISGLTDEHIDKVIDRLNQVFNGGREPLPSSGSINTTFELMYVKRELLTEADASNLKTKPIETMQTKILESEEATNAANVLNIWVIPNSLNTSVSNLSPQYTLGDPQTLIFPTPLKKVESHADVEEAMRAESDNPDDFKMSVSQLGITITYLDLAQALSGSVSGMRLEKLIGAFYGLLTPDNSIIENSGINEWTDTDYCSDTYTYIKPISSSYSVRKSTYPNPDMSGGQSLVYDSYNVMDDQTSAIGITKRQAVRMRQVMEDVPFRKQGTGGDSSEQPLDPWGMMEPF